MRCTNCKKKIDDNSLYCPECGMMINPRQGHGKQVSVTKTAGPSDRKWIAAVAGTCVLGVFVLVLGIIVGVNGIKDKKSAYEPADAALKDETELRQEEARQEEPREEESITESGISYEDAVDVIHNDTVYLTGIVRESNGGYQLFMEEDAVNICAYTDKGQEKRVEDIDTVDLVPDSGDLDFEGNKKAVVEVGGNILIRNDMPVMFVKNMTVIAKGSSEEEIHEYRIVQEDCTWKEAFDKCRDMGGYLVRINSEEEWNYIIEQIEKEGKVKVQLFIGARRDKDSKSYYWVDEDNNLTGDRLDSGHTKWLDSHWLGGEPSYEDKALKLEEDCISLFRYSKTNEWVLNDVPQDLIGALSTNKGKVGYICEIE